MSPTTLLHARSPLGPHGIRRGQYSDRRRRTSSTTSSSSFSRRAVLCHHLAIVHTHTHTCRIYTISRAIPTEKARHPRSAHTHVYITLAVVGGERAHRRAHGTGAIRAGAPSRLRSERRDASPGAAAITAVRSRARARAAPASIPIIHTRM